MLKLLYKTFLISVMSGSLMTMDMMAFAQSTSTSSSAIAKMSTGTDSGITRDANGVLKKTETHRFEARTNVDDMLSSITMLATGTIAGRMGASYRPITTDVMIAAVGGMIFMAGEIISNVKFNKTMEEMSIEITKSSDGKKDQAQIDRLIDLRKSYEEAKKTTNTKKILQLAAAAAFTGAAGLATYLAFQEDAMDAACTGAITMAEGGLAKCVTAGLIAGTTIPVGTALQAEGIQCQACLVELEAYQETYRTKDLKDKTAELSQAKEYKGKATEAFLSKGVCLTQQALGTQVKLIANGVNNACRSAMKFKISQQTSSTTPIPGAHTTSNSEKILNEILFGGSSAVASYELDQSNKKINFFDQFFGLFIPTSQAGWLPLLGLGAGTAASFFLISGTLGTAVDTQMYVPFNRALAFAALAGLSYSASKSSDNVMETIDQNITKIDVILKDLNTLQNGIKLNQPNMQQLKFATPQLIPAQDIPLSTNPSVKTDCATSMGAENCIPLVGQLSAMPGFADLPDSFKTIASQSAQLGDGLSGVNAVSGSTMTTASSLAGKQNAIAKLLAKTQSKLNDQLAGMGQPKIDFAKEQNDLLKKWNAETAKGLKSKGISPGNFLASIGGAPVSATAAAPKTARNKTTNKFFIPPNNTEAAAAAINNKGFELDLKEAPQKEEILAADTGSEKEKKFDIGFNDISTDSSESIFQLITNRYIKSGYPKLLDEIPVKK